MHNKYIAILLTSIMLSSIVSCGGETTANTASQESSSTETNEEEKTIEDASENKKAESSEMRSFSICDGLITADLPSEWNYDNSNDSMIYAYPSGNTNDPDAFAVFFGGLGVNYNDNDLEGILEEIGKQGPNGGDKNIEVKEYKSEFTEIDGFDTVLKQSYIKDYTPSGRNIQLYNEEYYYPIDNDGELGIMMASYTYDAEKGPKYQNEFTNVFLPAIKIKNQAGTGNSGNIEKNTKVTIDESVIYDENGIKAVLTGISDGQYGKSVVIDITNDSDQDISWAVDNIMVNDITIICAVTYPVPAGKAGTAEYPIEESYLQRYGITDIHTLQLACDISYGESGDNREYCMSDRVVTNLGSDFEQSLPIDDWEIVYESDSMKIYNTGLIEKANEYEDYQSQVVLMCFNDSDSMISVAPENVSFDGTMDYNNYTTFPVGPKSYGELYLACGEDANDKEEASFSIRVADGETYEEKYNTKSISMNLK